VYLWPHEQDPKGIRSQITEKFIQCGVVREPPFASITARNDDLDHPAAEAFAVADLNRCNLRDVAVNVW
jgi:hypothetical protein